MKEQRVTYRLEFKNLFGYWEEFDTYSSKERAMKEYGSNPEERLIKVQETIIQEHE